MMESRDSYAEMTVLSGCFDAVLVLKFLWKSLCSANAPCPHHLVSFLHAQVGEREADEDHDSREEHESGVGLVHLAARDHRV